MNSGEISARLIPSGNWVRVVWQRGVISDIAPAEAGSEAGDWLAPPLLDLQVNGFAGVDFQQDDLPGPHLERAVQGLHQAGCGQFLVTLITDDWQRMLHRLSQLRALRHRSPVLRRAIVGWHFEGPFLSSEPGYCGAHPAASMRDPSRNDIQELHAAIEGDPVLLTLAPERQGALDAIALAVELGLRVSLGHTNASAEILRQAVAAGARGFTHLANACPQALDRHDNILWRVLDTPGLTVSLIPDTIHVSPALFRLVHRVLPESSIYYTTDAVAPAGAPPGLYTVGPHHVQVGPEGIVRQPGRSNYAGSALTPLEGVGRAAAMLSRRWSAVWPLLSIHPARLMGWQNSIVVGAPANLALLDTSGGRPAVRKLFVHGELAWVRDQE